MFTSHSETECEHLHDILLILFACVFLSCFLVLSYPLNMGFDFGAYLFTSETSVMRSLISSQVPSGGLPGYHISIVKIIFDNL